MLSSDQRERLSVMVEKETSYLSFLLRLWRVSNDGVPEWRASLEHPHTGERFGFANLVQLTEFLEHQTDVASTKIQDAKNNA
jgi:hypothetical protein